MDSHATRWKQSTLPARKQLCDNRVSRDPAGAGGRGLKGIGEKHLVGRLL
jgi:hypothetical protein